MTNPSSEIELREQIADILKEHEDHSPIYTCRYQIVDQLLDLIHQRERQVRKETQKSLTNLLNEWGDCGCCMLGDELKAYLKSLEEED